jgi:hypothetical protein
MSLKLVSLLGMMVFIAVAWAMAYEQGAGVVVVTCDHRSPDVF